MDVRVYGTRATIVLELYNGSMSLHHFDGKVTEYPDLAKEVAYPLEDPAKNLIDVVAGDAPNRSPATLGFSAMKIVDAACRSAETGLNMRIQGCEITPMS